MKVITLRLYRALARAFPQEFLRGRDCPDLRSGAPLLLASLALAACYIPARKSIRIDPVVALRQE